MSSSLNDPRNWLDVVPQTLHASPLYRALWERMKDDAEILALMDLIEKDQPLPITFFTAINYLVLGEPHEALGHFYPYLYPEGAWPASEAYPAFRAFVLAHQDVLREILPTARLQTNEVTRCANLLPAFVLAYQHGGYQALSMIEIGSSAGLNLLWNQYGYRYQYADMVPALDVVVGNRTAPVQVQCHMAPTPGFPITSMTTLPFVAQCQGIEMCPRDIHDEQDRRWVRAAIWPEEVERYRTLDTALALASCTPLPLHTGDAGDVLPELLAAIPTTRTVVVWHSFALNQGPMAVKQRIEEQMAEASQRMPIYRVSLEMAPAPVVRPRLEWSVYEDGKMSRGEVLAECAIHGERMTWLADPHCF